MKKIEEYLNIDLSQEENGMFHFIITGDEAELWFLNINHGQGSWGEGNGGVKAGVTFTINSNDLLDMFSDKLKATSAFMSGKLKIIKH